MTFLSILLPQEIFAQCTVCKTKPKSCESLHQLKDLLKTNVTDFCANKWSDDLLLEVLTEILSWSDTDKQLFLIAYNNNVAFKQSINDVPQLTWAWSAIQPRTTELPALRTARAADVKVLTDFKAKLGAYPDITKKLTTFREATQFRFAKNFVNVADPSLAKFNDNNAIGVDLWLKYQLEFEKKPYKDVVALTAVEIRDKYKTSQPNWYDLINTNMLTVCSQGETCVSSCVHSDAVKSISTFKNFKTGIEDGNVPEEALKVIAPKPISNFGRYYNALASEWIPKTKEVLHPIFKERALYLNIIRSCNDYVLWRNLLGTGAANDSEWEKIRIKITAANFAGAHSEVRALSDLFFALEANAVAKNKTFELNTESNKIAIFIRVYDNKVKEQVTDATGKSITQSVLTAFPRCPCCFYLIEPLNINVLSEPK